MADEPTMRELAALLEHKLSDTREDILDLKMRLDVALTQQREQFSLYVLSAVYEADKRTVAVAADAAAERLAKIEQQLETARQNSRMAILTAVGAFLGAVALAALSAWLKGH